MIDLRDQQGQVRPALHLQVHPTTKLQIGREQRQGGGRLAQHGAFHTIEPKALPPVQPGLIQTDQGTANRQLGEIETNKYTHGSAT